MKVFDASGIRNVALVGHSGAGKTQLVSAMLFDAGAVNRFGRVDDGSTVTDYDEEAIARKHTLAASLANLEWNKQKINVIDTPGMGNFLIMGLFGLIFASVATLFFHSPALYFAINLIGVLIFAGLIAANTQQLKGIYYQVGGDAAAMNVATSYGALRLYLDFVNLFQYLLYFTGGSRR